MAFRIPAGELFPALVVQGCLADPSIPEEFRGRMVKNITGKNGELRSGDRLDDGPREEFWDFPMCFNIWGARDLFEGVISLHRASATEDWDSATCDLNIWGSPDRIWKFKAEITTDGKLQVELTGHPDLAKPEYQYAEPGSGPIQHD